MSKLLRSTESPHQVLPELATWIGLNEAIILQQLHWQIYNEKGQVIGGVRWVRMTVEEWQDIFPYFDHNAIKRVLGNLQSDGLILSATFTGRSKWYTVCYAAVDQLNGPVDRVVELSNKRREARHKVSAQIVPIEENNDALAQIVPISGTNSADTSAQIVPLLRDKNLKDSLFLKRAHEKNLTLPGPLAVSVLETCELDFDAVETVKGVKLDLLDTLSFLIKKQADPGQIRSLRRYWDAHDYRSVKGTKSPSLKQLAEIWIPFTKWLAAGCPDPKPAQNRNGAYNKNGYHKPKQPAPVVPADPDDQARLKRMQATLAALAANDTG